MDAVHIIHSDDPSLLYFSNWVDLHLINHKQTSIDEFLEKFNKKFGNVVEYVKDFYLNNLIKNLNIEKIDLTVESHLNVEKNTAKLLIIAKKLPIKNQAIVSNLCLSLIQNLDYFSFAQKNKKNDGIILTGTKLTDIHRKIIEQSTKCLPFIISNFECRQEEIYIEILRVLHSLIENKISSQITLTLVDTLLSVQLIVYSDKLKNYLLYRLNGQIYTDDFLFTHCKRFYDDFFNSDSLTVTRIGVARAIMMMDYRLLDHGQDIMFLGLQPGVSIDMTQMSLIGMQSYLSAFLFWYKNGYSECIYTRFMRLIRVLTNVWESRARRSAHLAISLYEEIIKFLSNTKNPKFLKIASDASEHVLNQFNHRKKLYFTSIDITIPFLGVFHFLDQKPNLIIELIISMGDLNTRSIAAKLLRRIFSNILCEVTLSDFRSKFYPLIASIFKNNLPSSNPLKLSEFSQTSISNYVLDILFCFDTECYLYLLWYMQLEQPSTIDKTRYGHLLVPDEDFDAGSKDIYITSEMTIAESIILLSAKNRNKLFFSNIDSEALIIVGDAVPKFFISLDRVIYSILSNEHIRINILEAMILSPKLIKPDFINSFLTLLGIKTSFAIASQEFKQLEIVLYTNFFNRFKNYTKIMSEGNFDFINLSKFEHFEIINKINLLTPKTDILTYFLRSADFLLSQEFFLGANFDRLEAALKISKKLIEILFDEYIKYSDFHIIKAILKSFDIIPDQLLDLSFNIIILIPVDIIIKIMPSTISVDNYIYDIRPLCYIRGAYLHLLQSKLQGNLDSMYPIHLLDLIDIDALILFLENYFNSMDQPQPEEFNFDSPVGYLYEFIVIVDYFKAKNIEFDVFLYIKKIKFFLIKLGKYIINKNIEKPSLFDCRGHIIHNNTTDCLYKEYFIEDLGNYKFGIFKPKRRLKFVKTPFSECVTSLIWKSLSLLITSGTALINYIFPKCRKSNKWDCINYKIINYELLDEIYSFGDFVITLLLNSKHLGLIDSCIDFLNAIVPKLKYGFKMPTEEYVFRWYDRALGILKQPTDQLSMYRFDNLSSCIAALLASQSKVEDKNLSLLISMLLDNTLTRSRTLDLLRTIVKSSRLAYFLNKYIYDILYYSLECITDDWSIANSASLLFSACISYLDVISPSLSKTSPQNRNLSDMFNCNSKLRNLIISSLDVSSKNTRQMALVLILIIKFSGGDEFLFLLYDLLSFKDDGIRNLVSIAIAKYSNINILCEYLNNFNKWEDFNLIHGLLLTIEKIKLNAHSNDAIKNWLLKLYCLKLPFPILPSLLYLSNKFIFIAPLNEYKYLLQVVLSSFGKDFFGEIMRHLEPFLGDFGLKFVFFPSNLSIKSAALPFLFQLFDVIQLEPNGEIIKLLEEHLGDMYIDLSPIGEKWYMLGPKLLPNRLDESCLSFCYKYCHNNPMEYVNILIDILSTEAYIGYNELSILSQLTMKIIASVRDNSELNDLAEGVVQVVTDDHTDAKIKLSFLESLEDIDIFRDVSIAKHLWKRLIYLLQDESSDVRKKASSIISKQLDKKDMLWCITEDLACTLTGIDKPSKTYNTNYQIDVTKRKFALFMVESPNIYRERTY